MIIIEILQIIHAMIAIIAGWISGDLAVDLGLTFAWRRPVLKSKAKYRGALSFAVLGVIIIPQKWRKDGRWRRWGNAVIAHEDGHCSEKEGKAIFGWSELLRNDLLKAKMPLEVILHSCETVQLAEATADRHACELGYAMELYEFLEYVRDWAEKNGADFGQDLNDRLFRISVFLGTGRYPMEGVIKHLPTSKDMPFVQQFEFAARKAALRR